MRRFGKFGAMLLAVLALLALSVSVAFAAVPAGTYLPTADSFNPANAPASSHLTSGSPSCTVDTNTPPAISCSAYVLGGVGHTNATASLAASYTATVQCRNHGGQIVDVK